VSWGSLRDVDQPRIFLSPPDVGKCEEERVSDAIRSGWVAPVGPHLELFEKAVAELAGRKYAVGVSSGTAALHLGLLALGVKPGDRVLCSTLTFVATANAISYVGATPVFVDSEISSGNMSVELLEEAILDLLSAGKKIGAVIPVDFLGSVAKYEEIMPLCQRFGIPVLADAAEAVGAVRHSQPAGSFGDAAIFSFNGNKIATTSGGGAFLTDNVDQAKKVRHLATQAREPVKHYEHKVLGFNYRLSNVLAAIGVAQLERLSEIVARRRENRLSYRSLFDSIEGVQVMGESDSEDNCWLTALLIDPAVAGFSSAELSEFLEDSNVESRPLWKPMHSQPLYKGGESYVNGSAEKLFLQGLVVPSGSTLGGVEWERLNHLIGSFLSNTKQNGTLSRG